MPKIKCKVLATKKDGNTYLAKIQCNGSLPPINQIADLKWGSTRSLPQNSLWWKYLEWLINDAGLKDKGHFCTVALHDNFKSHFKIKTTTDMTKSEFSEYMEKVDALVQDFFEIDTSPFWTTHTEEK